MRILSALIILLLACPAFAQSSATRNTAEQLLTGWKSWMEDNSLTSGAIAISHNGKLVATDGIDREPTDPAPVASLSKSITAICALLALEDTDQTHKLKLSAAMPAFLSKFRVKDRRLFNVTIGQLITHDSGIQSAFTDRYSTFETFAKPQKELQMRSIVLERLGSNPGRSNYHYSNANYLALGIVIEELTGEPYEPYCKRTVLAPLGITTARISTDWAVTSSFGGWEISAQDYLTFLNAHFENGLILGQSPTRFQPRVHIGNNRYYGPGVLFRKTGKGTLIWHAGSWKWQDGTIDDAFGAYFIMLDSGFAISLNFEGDGTPNAFASLEQMIWNITQ